MKLSVSAYRAHASAHKKILSSSYQLNYGSTAPAPSSCATLPQFTVEEPERRAITYNNKNDDNGGDQGSSEEPGTGSLVQSLATSRDEDDDSSNNASSDGKSPGQRKSVKTGIYDVNAARKLAPKEKLLSKDEDGNFNVKNYGTRGKSCKSAATESDQEQPEEGPSRKMSGSQNWKNVKAVMAYYYSLRKIKRTKSNQRWMKLRTTVQLSSAISTIQKKPPLKREDSFLKRFSTRQIPETQETVEDTGSEGGGAGGGAGGAGAPLSRRRRRAPRPPRTVVNPDENFYFYWLWLLTGCVLYNLWTLIVRQSFPELQELATNFWFACDCFTDLVFAADLVVQLRTGYLEQGLMVYDSKKLAGHYLNSRAFLLDLLALTPLDLLQLRFGTNPMLRFPRFLKVYRAINCYYIVESRTVYPNFWRVINLIHILLILAHWFGCFYFLLSEAEGFQGDWVYPHRPGDYATLTRKYLGSLYWSTLTLTTIGDLPTPETNAEASQSADGPKSLPRRGLKSRLLQFRSNGGYVFTIVSYLIGVFIFATIVGQVGNVITNRNANRLEFERLLDGAKTYMRHHKVPGGMKRRVLRWYDYSWSRGRIQGGGDINTALGLLPDKLKTELALHVNLSVLKKVTIFQECQPEFLHDLVLKMKAYIFTPGDSICRKGEVAREMFIIADGILEVISETGRVLTTMKAGDFFGEIGILNLDGLNKRTADVRSVGYSELFSLSREDVLAAMKDYPEAQEILQTLGRKRLQEARSCSRKAKGESVDDKLDGDDNSGPKRIVHRLRSDVKGLRNALRSRSRPTRRSINGDSLEMRALGNAASIGSTGSTGPKGVLRRMPRVESDENHHAEDEGSGSADPSSGAKDEKVISPLGAGLPLLARLKLLKERQEREEKEATRQHAIPIPQVATTTCQPASTTPSEPEVIGAGLPLLQRLLLLKAKEDREKSLMGPSTSGVDKITLSSNPPSSTDTISPSSLKSPLSPTVKTLSPIQKGSGSNSSGKSLSPTAKPSRKNSSGSSDSSSKPKVSFKDKIMKVQADGTSVSQPLSKEKDVSGKKIKTSDKVPPILKSDNLTSTLQIESNQIPQTQPISIPSSVVNRIKSPVKMVGTTFRDKLKLLQGSSPSSKESLVSNIVPNKVDILSPSAKKVNIDTKLQQTSDIENSSSVEITKEQLSPKRPWSKLKKAAILGDSRDSSSSRQSSVGSESFKEKSVSPSCITESAKTDTSAKNTALSTLELGKVTPSPVTSSDTIMPSLSSNVSNKGTLGLDSRTDSEKINKSGMASVSSSPKDNIISYESITQKDGETVLKSSEASNVFSFNECSPSTYRMESKSPSKVLVTKKNKSYVSVEDLSPEFGMLPFVKKLKILNERQKLAELENEIKTKRSSSFDYADNGSEVDKLIRCNSEGSSTIKRPKNQSRRNVLNLGDSIGDSQILLSPESNETIERRNLKSILKKLSEDVQESSAYCSREFKRLIRAPTIEGYAARHSKFSKSVTFNRDTLTSPPDSATELKPLFPISNPYQRLNNAPSAESCDNLDKEDGWFYSDNREPSSLTSNNLENLSRNGEFIGLENSPILSDILTDDSKDLGEFQPSLDPKYNYNRPVLENIHPEQIKVPTEKPKLSIISAMANQRKLFRGSLEEQEYFGEVLMGIKHVIQGHLHEVQGKFQDRFNNLELEVKKRDEIISQLQNRIQELEKVGLTTNGSTTSTNINIQPARANSFEGDDKTIMEDLLSHEADTISGLTASSGSDEISMDQGFMRGDSLDTVFTTSPPNTIAVDDENDNINRLNEPESFILSQPPRNINITDEAFDRLNLDLEQLTDYPMQRTIDKSNDNIKRRDSKTGLPELTYSRHKAAKLKEKRSWEQNTDQENIEIQNLSRSFSPGSEQHMLLSPETKASHQKLKRASHAFHLFGSHLDSTKSKIKKTSSMDTGIHHTGIKGESVSSDQEHRKFSLGSFFGYKGGHSTSKQSAGFLIPSQNRKGFHQHESVILDMGTEYASSDGNSSSTSSSSGDSDYIPRAPAFEQFHGRRDSASSIMSSRGRSATSSGSGGDWEVFMLAEELDRRERDEARRIRGSQGRRTGEPSVLNSLEEESDTPITPQHHGIGFAEVEDLPHHSESIDQYCPQRLQKTGSFSGSSSSTAEWLHRRSRGLILRASSLEHPEPSRSPPGSILPGRLDSFKSSSTDGHKRL